jgi:hypothetical protein
MPQVQLHPDAEKRTYLRPGQYGPGLAHQAECEVTDYQFPADEPPRYRPDDPAENWCHIRIRVNSEEYGNATIFHHEPISDHSGSKLGPWLVAMGVPCEGAGYAHDTDQVVGRSVAVEVGDVREDKNEAGKYYTGNLLQVFGA